MTNYRGWVKTKPRKVSKPVVGIYSVTTSTYRKIFVYAETPQEAVTKTTNSLTRQESILSVGRENGK